ncbi:MAG: glycosyltransferase family 2 protein [Chitinophagales bacterium]|nr:glycosyltransferase family 2 protein [Chitinophagales bacterium]MDW8419703.1 glycosyltransferase family 2 protein [Chitinophagales bacterium]
MNVAKKVAVVILSWNGRKYLEQFLPSVVRYTDPHLCDIVVADNCSDDDSVAFVRKNYPQVRVLVNSRNGGYAGGYNEALRQTEATYYVLLNQDMEVTEDWVERVVEKMEKDERIAAAQPKILSYHERDKFEYAGAAGGYLDMWGYAFCRGRIFQVIEKDMGQYDDAVNIFWASGACMFVRAKAFWEAGGFDEDFFAHQEEVDLCWRLQHKGYRIIAVPEAVVYHVGGGSLSYQNPHKTYLNFRNSMMMLLKNLPAAQLWKIPVRFVFDFAALIHATLKERNLKTACAIHRAHLHFCLAVPELWIKRKQITQRNNGLLYPGSIVWQHFVLGKKYFYELPDNTSAQNTAQ